VREVETSSPRTRMDVIGTGDAGGTDVGLLLALELEWEMGT
jgi:hypothetical protein